jgi:hypothetical protein
VRPNRIHLDCFAARGNVRKALGILKRAGVGNPPMKGDKLPTK